MPPHLPWFLSALLVTASAAAGQQAGARRLVYELRVDALQRSLRERPKDDLEPMLAGTIATLQARLGEEVEVRRDGATGCVVVVPPGHADEVAAIRRLVEREASLELRITAAGERREGEFAFDLAAERARLQAWLAAGGRERVLADPDALRVFHSDSTVGPVAGARLQWRVHRLRPQVGAPTRWEPRFADHPVLRDACVALFSDREWNDGRVPAERPGEPVPSSLVELVALDFAQRGFTGADIDPDAVVEAPNGEAGVGYRMLASTRKAYGDWSQANVKRSSAIVWNGEVVSAPTFLGRIDGVGVIMGTMSRTEVAELVRFLRAGGVIVPPRFVREEPATGR